MEDFVARPSPWRIALMLLAALGFVAIGLWMTGIFGPPPKPGREWLGWLAVAFFGAITPIMVMRLFDGRDQVRISARGVYFRQWSEDTIPWSQIKDVTQWAYRGNRFIVLHLRAPECYPSSRLLGRMAGLNRSMTGGDITVSLAGTSARFNDAMEAIARYHRPH
jgi:hypothetical protein